MQDKSCLSKADRCSMHLQCCGTRAGHCSCLQKCKGFPVGCQANWRRPAVVVAQWMTDALFLFVQLVAILQRAVGCPPQEASVMIVKRLRTSFLLFYICNNALCYGGQHVHRTSAPHIANVFVKQVSQQLQVHSCAHQAKSSTSRGISW